MDSTDYVIRRAKIEDMQNIRNMIQVTDYDYEVQIRNQRPQRPPSNSYNIKNKELADFQGMGSGPKLSTEDLIRDSGLNGQPEYFHCYIAEAINKTSDDSPQRPLTRTPIGYALCFFTYSTWQGKSYFIEDIYVRPDYRKKGLGRLLLKEIAKNAKLYGCLRIDFHVLEWNPSKNFYEKMGAVNLTKLESWNFYRLDGNAIDQLNE